MKTEEEIRKLWKEWKINNKKQMGNILIKDYEKLEIRQKEIWNKIKILRDSLK